MAKIAKMKGRDETAAVAALAAGRIVVMPTDTIYGIVGSALCRTTVAEIYRLRKRNPKKPVIILVAAPEEVRHFGVRLDQRTKRLLRNMWPGKVSVVLPIASGAAVVRKFAYLHRGANSLAFRVPRLAWLRALLAKTGPLVAPSANHEGKPPAATIHEAKRYFGKKVPLYVDAGRLASPPSTLVKIEKGKVAILRQGAARIRGAALGGTR